jgi:predicted enzyme related to lactoylglutathione lyase
VTEHLPPISSPNFLTGTCNARERQITSERGDIGGHITALGHEPHNYASVYIGVDDVQAYLDKAISLGGMALLPVITIPSGQFSCFAELDGNIIGLFKDKPAG